VNSDSQLKFILLQFL